MASLPLPASLPSPLPPAVAVPLPIQERLAALRGLVGDTPLLEITCRLRGRDLRVWAKHEVLNLTGSIKDRMALHMLERAYASGALRPGDEIVEATSGNTGIAFSALGRALGHPVRIYMPDWMSHERVDLLAGFGATYVPVSAAEGGFLGSIALADAYAAENPRSFRPRQFDNHENARAHELTTGPELLAQLAHGSLLPTGFVAGVGTGGTVMGVGRYLRARVGPIAIHPLEPANSPTLRTGRCSGTHRIQGISDEFVPSIVDLASLDGIVDVWDGDAILMAQRLARELGLGVGISSGANLLGALEVSLAQGAGAVVATVFSDSNKKYLSTALCKQEPVRAGYLTPEVELVNLRVLPRASALCG